MDNNSTNNSKKAANKPSSTPQFDHNHLADEQNQATENYSQSAAADNQEPQTNIYPESNPPPPTPMPKQAQQSLGKYLLLFAWPVLLLYSFSKSYNLRHVWILQ